MPVIATFAPASRNADATAPPSPPLPKDKTDPLQVQLMLHGPMDPFFAQMENAAATWDGREPIRNALDLLPPTMRPPQEV